jgi:hypothetical protein
VPDLGAVQKKPQWSPLSAAIGALMAESRLLQMRDQAASSGACVVESCASGEPPVDAAGR